MNLTASPETYRKRRARLAARLQRPLVMPAGQARARQHATNTHPFRAGSSYLYFGGPSLEGAALVIEPKANGRDGCTLLRVPAGPDDALWHGQLPGDAASASSAGLDASAIRESTTVLVSSLTMVAAPLSITSHKPRKLIVPPIELTFTINFPIPSKCSTSAPNCPMFLISIPPS